MDLRDAAADMIVRSNKPKPSKQQNQLWSDLKQDTAGNVTTTTEGLPDFRND